MLTAKKKICEKPNLVSELRGLSNNSVLTEESLAPTIKKVLNKGTYSRASKAIKHLVIGA